ncbi:MAG: SPL family radical SAM protein [Thermodesulfovibrionales bacterium]
MKIKEILSKNILSKSKVYEYTLNPYIGCEYGCIYCYARFMKKFTGHKEKWGMFIDVKINALELLKKEIKKKRPERVWMSSICDPYQPIEREYRLTRRCLEILIDNGWPVTIQTKSHLVLRDIGLLKQSNKIEVCLTITTADEKIKRIFEPFAPSIENRIKALAKLHSEGIKTQVMIAPLLPGTKGLVKELNGKVDFVIIDRMNYHYADWAYREHKIEWARSDGFFLSQGKELKRLFEKEGIPCEVLMHR